jgi:hypothetical protein
MALQAIFGGFEGTQTSKKQARSMSIPGSRAFYKKILAEDSFNRISN